jgi:ABC-type lipoprotein export system ATPase subunit
LLLCAGGGRLKQSTTIIIFTHSKALMDIADSLYEIQDGKVQAVSREAAAC